MLPYNYKWQVPRYQTGGVRDRSLVMPRNTDTINGVHNFEVTNYLPEAGSKYPGIKPNASADPSYHRHLYNIPNKPKDTLTPQSNRSYQKEKFLNDFNSGDPSTYLDIPQKLLTSAATSLTRGSANLKYDKPSSIIRDDWGSENVISQWALDAFMDPLKMFGSLGSSGKTWDYIRSIYGALQKYDNIQDAVEIGKAEPESKQNQTK